MALFYEELERERSVALFYEGRKQAGKARDSAALFGPGNALWRFSMKS